MPADPRAIDHRDRTLEIERKDLRQDPIEEGKHLVVRVRAVPEQDDPWAISLFEPPAVVGSPNRR